MDSTLVTVAVITALPGMLAAVSGWHNGRKIDKAERKIDVGIAKVDQVQITTEATDAKLTTANTLEVGELLDAAATRDIKKIPADQRTPTETAHAASVAMKTAEDASALANVREQQSKGNGRPGHESGGSA